MEAIVTGATGCLGLNLTKRLIYEGYDVIATGRNENLGHVISQLGAKFIALDLQEKTTLKQLSRNADVIFHCAALSSPWGSYNNFYQSNVLGTQHVIDATPAHARLIHISSPSIYFDFTEKHNIKEDTLLPSKPANHYIKTKLMAEHLIDKAYNEKKLQVVTIRPRGIFGPYDRSIIPRLLQAEKKGVLPIIGTGKNSIDITYVDNVVESLLLAAKANANVLGKKYNITNDQPKKLIDILTMMFGALHKPLMCKYISYPAANVIASVMETIYRILPFKSEPLITRYSAGVLALGQTLNIDAAKQDLRYKPIASLEEGMRAYAEWFGGL
jgi:nucleoside-diphosphate-sugar epimerase